ncbi:MAG: hypothetical protein QMD04_00430 [Anaerolineales bacterium]|nr:hypothetical protein [Anaerolineales bacterium]
MTTEIFIPHPLTRAAERLARRLGISLNELYTAALNAYVTEHQEGEVTEMLNQLYDAETSAMEPAMIQLQVNALGGETW